MQRNIQLIAALTLLSAPALSQERAMDNTAAKPRTIAEMINAASVSYQTAEKANFSAARTNEVSSDLLLFTGMNMASAPITPDGQAFFHSDTDNSAMLHIDTLTGSVIFSKGTRDLSGLENTPALPTKGAAAGIARDLLGQLDFAPAEESQLFVEHVGGVGMGVEKPDGSTETFEKLRTVRFGRTMGGLKVEGPGSRIVVQLGENGELRGLVHRWQELAPMAIAPQQKLSPSELRSMVAFRIQQAASHAAEIKFESADLVLYDDGQGTIEPVIRVVVEQTIISEFQNEDGEREERVIQNPLDFYLPILRQPNARLPYVKDLEAKVAATPEIDNE